MIDIVIFPCSFRIWINNNHQFTKNYTKRVFIHSFFYQKLLHIRRHTCFINITRTENFHISQTWPSLQQLHPNDL